VSVLSTGLSDYESHVAKPLTVTVGTAKKLSGLGNTTIWALIIALRQTGKFQTFSPNEQLQKIKEEPSEKAPPSNALYAFFFCRVPLDRGHFGAS
jgi:hypothetical protein